MWITWWMRLRKMALAFPLLYCKWRLCTVFIKRQMYNAWIQGKMENISLRRVHKSICRLFQDDAFCNGKLSMFDNFSWISLFSFSRSPFSLWFMRAYLVVHASIKGKRIVLYHVYHSFCANDFFSQLKGKYLLSARYALSTKTGIIIPIESGKVRWVSGSLGLIRDLWPWTLFNYCLVVYIGDRHFNV